ncbi:FAD/NAD(P)-binding domain-containing protein [Wolfiporia cocos MD-104 SS10]|uniref:FAD/NAD(P)-binding domain-containing protein n=1 Tax=Wolfiporia cocos (strain MD-104) TaxID=742152 RepID=A0A2H3IZ68_WOLCO|nr:FAD/NAD(P)-binding domain-containing protein [Wolfiporia cocos MD-104 SS10]
MDLLPNPAIEASKQAEVQEICIVGAGPGGLAALQIIMETPQYKAGLWKPTAFEEREKAGGIWVPAPPVDNPPKTPLYDSLTTNLPHPVMCFQSYSFPPSTPLFPPASTVEKYLSDFASHFDMNQHIRLNTPVTAVDWDTASSKWKVKVRGDEVHEFDLLIVANGHYRLPRYPTTPGLGAWLAAGKATHSAWYRRPEHHGKTVLVVGGGPSGNDISSDMREVAKVVIQSVSRGTSEDIDGGKFKKRGRLAELLDINEGRVLFEDGTVETGIDHCILATGYQHHLPFLPSSLLKLAVPPPVPPLPEHLYNSSYHLFPLARHLFPLSKSFPPSRLAFLCVLRAIAPLPVMEAQVRAALAAFAHPEILDPTQEAVDILTHYEDLRARFGDNDLQIAAAWHVFEPQQQFDYRDELHALAGGRYAGPEWKVPQWVRDMYMERDVLRSEWRDLERRGEAEDWVRGVGEGGIEEWIELMHKLLKRADERHRNDEDQTAKL